MRRVHHLQMFESIQAAASAGSAGGSEGLEEMMQGLAQQDLKLEQKRLELQLRLTREQLAQEEQTFKKESAENQAEKSIIATELAEMRPRAAAAVRELLIASAVPEPATFRFTAAMRQLTKNALEMTG